MEAPLLHDTMPDPLRVYVIHQDGSEEGAGLQGFLARAFDCIGMRRDELRFSVPVHSRCTPWNGSQAGPPRPIALESAVRNLIVVVWDAQFDHLRRTWEPYMAALADAVAKRPQDLLIPVFIGAVQGANGAATQSMKLRSTRELDDPSAAARFLIRLLNAVLVRGDRDGGGEGPGGHPIFVSHAKRDGTAYAVRIIELIQRVNQGLGPRCFFDNDSLVPGDDYHQRFQSAIARGSLLAIVTSVYHSRPWCRWEVLTAKRHGRPVVAADLTNGRIERTFPYLGNVPSIRLGQADDRALSDRDVEILTLALLTEALRVELWKDLATRYAATGDRLCIRPPELSDLALAAFDLHPVSGKARRILYPDPPLGTEEMELLHEAFPDIDICTLSEVAE
jgi:hypothetical protein